MSNELWNDNNIIWNDNPFLWNNVYEITAEVSTNRNVFVNVQEKINKHHKKDGLKWVGKKYVKIICVISDKEFEQKKYINKNLKIEASDEEFIIRDIKKIDMSVNEVELKMNPISEDDFYIGTYDDKIKINVTDINLA